MGNKNSVPKCTPLGCILRNWEVFANELMTKKKMISFCNTVWPQYSLDSGERWPENGSLNYNTILQLDLFCKREEKLFEIQYVQSFMLLYQHKKIQRKYMIWAPKENPQKEVISPDYHVKIDDPSPVQSNTATPRPLGDAGAIVPRHSAPQAPTSCPSPPDPAGPLVVSPSPTCQDTLLDQGATHIQAGRVPFGPWLFGGLHGNGQPHGLIFVRSVFSTSDLLNWKISMPPYLDDPIRMENFFASIFATHNPTWADIQTLLNFFLTSEERSLILERARAEADKMHVEAPYNPVRAIGDLAIPTTDPRWSPNDLRDRNKLEHYRSCILKGLKNGVPKQRSLNKILQVRQKPDEDPSDYLERMCKAYRQYADIDPEAPENLHMVNDTFIRQAAPDIQKKLQGVRGALVMPTYQLVEIAFDVFRNRDKVRQEEEERRMWRQAALLADALRPVWSDPHQCPHQPGARPKITYPRPSNSRSRGHPKVGPNQCAYCKREGHWKKECPSLNKYR
ncbi:uncharacterized protein LOC121099896 [Ursus maritimus]|uniref:Uncharacterized protein LOC121099896 n=1 Tax=Ursus maritimus TaxID=29073 RepID=A0A8M1F3B6_URSMA|nr:uncharacterized protein LOC121099896 [Ursus maritimus]